MLYRAGRDVVETSRAISRSTLAPEVVRKEINRRGRGQAATPLPYRTDMAVCAGITEANVDDGSVNRHQPPAPPGAEPARTGSRDPVASAEHAALGPPPNRPGPVPGRRGTSRNKQHPKLSGAA
jgi:hypothetical protein